MFCAGRVLPSARGGFVPRVRGMCRPGGRCGFVIRMARVRIADGARPIRGCVSRMPLVSCRGVRPPGVVRVVIRACPDVVRSVLRVIHRAGLGVVVRAGRMCSVGIRRVRGGGLPCGPPLCIMVVMPIGRSARCERRA